MYLKLEVLPGAIKQTTSYMADIFKNQKPFPVMLIDVDSYIVNAKMETVLETRMADGVYNLQIGKYSALAEDILFLVDVNHDYTRVFMGAISAFPAHSAASTMKRKGQIIIQNDCWIGNGATIMGGVTVHNGAVIAAKSVVTKSVPPYAIVGGNPARIIKYRFNDLQISQLQRIAWWDWCHEKIRANQTLLCGKIEDLISAHIDEAHESFQNVPPLRGHNNGNSKFKYLFIPDFDEPYSVYEKVIVEFNHRQRNGDDMLIYIKPDNKQNENKAKIDKLLEANSVSSTNIVTYMEPLEDERSLFTAAKAYITTRSKENVMRMCLADIYNIPSVSGVDIPVFTEEIETPSYEAKS